MEPERMINKIKRDMKQRFSLPVLCKFDPEESQFSVQVFNADDEDAKSDIQEAILDYEDELFPNCEYLIVPHVYTKDETRTWYPEMAVNVTPPPPVGSATSIYGISSYTYNQVSCSIYTDSSLAA